MKLNNLKSISWLLFDKILKSALSLTVFVYVARKLGPEVFGIVALAQGTLSILVTLGGFGLDSPTVKEFAYGGERLDQRISSIFIIRACASLTGLFAFNVYMMSSVHSSENFVLASIICLPALYIPFSIFLASHQANGSFGAIVVAQSIASIVCAFFRFWIVKLHLSLYWLAFALTAESTISLLLIVLQTPALRSFRLVRPSSDMLKDHFREGFPILVSSLAVVLYMRLDQFMIAAISGTGESAVYAAAVRFTELWYFIPVMLSAVIFPKLARLYRDDEANFRRSMRDLTYVLTCGAIVLVILGDVTSWWLLPHLLGPQYLAAARVSMIYNVALVFVFTGVIRGQYLLIAKLNKFNLVATLSGLGVNIVLNIPLIRFLGAEGAAIATVTSYAISAWLSSYGPAQLRWYARYQSQAILSIFSPRLVFNRAVFLKKEWL